MVASASLFTLYSAKYAASMECHQPTHSHFLASSSWTCAVSGGENLCEAGSSNTWNIALNIMWMWHFIVHVLGALLFTYSKMAQRLQTETTSRLSVHDSEDRTYVNANHLSQSLPWRGEHKNYAYRKRLFFTGQGLKFYNALGTFNLELTIRTTRKIYRATTYETQTRNTNADQGSSGLVAQAALAIQQV